jgi:hypothetical protein
MRWLREHREAIVIALAAGFLGSVAGAYAVQGLDWLGPRALSLASNAQFWQWVLVGGGCALAIKLRWKNWQARWQIGTWLWSMVRTPEGEWDDMREPSDALVRLLNFEWL